MTHPGATTAKPKMPIDIEKCPPLTLFTSSETAQLPRLSSASVRRFALDGRHRLNALTRRDLQLPPSRK
jgi:hypothetical protein